MGSANFNTEEITRDEHQRFVDTFFHDHSSYWRDVYHADTLRAFIYRERRSAVLSMVDKLRLPESSHVLEVGCGAGSTSVALARRGYKVTAVDTVDDMIHFTRQAVDRAGLGTNVETTSADICHLSFPGRHFDLILAVGVIPWLEQPGNAISELYRVVKRGGYVILTAANTWCLSQILDPLCFPGLRPLRWQIANILENLNIRKRSKPRLHWHSIKEIDALLRRSGFHKLAGRTLGFGPFTLFGHKLLPEPAGVKVHHKIQSLADRQFPGIRSFGVGYIVCAQKS
jgi:ubiquinone/menaquinone biosynthesis C-methylase UbiE